MKKQLTLMLLRNTSKVFKEITPSSTFSSSITPESFMYKAPMKCPSKALAGNFFISVNSNSKKFKFEGNLSNLEFRKKAETALYCVTFLQINADDFRTPSQQV